MATIDIEVLQIFHLEGKLYLYVYYISVPKTRATRTKQGYNTDLLRISIIVSTSFAVKITVFKNSYDMTETARLRRDLRCLSL